MTNTIAIIGAGWAGCAAALALAKAGSHVTLIEAGPAPGGRARRIHYQGADLDNGCHILIGAYSATLAAMRDAGVDVEAAFDRRPLELVVNGRLAMRAARLPAPCHLAWALVTAKGLGPGGRRAMLRLMRRVPAMAHSTYDTTVAAWLMQLQQPATITQLVWQPLCVATLNTPMDVASAKSFARILNDSLLASSSDSELLLPKRDLSAMFPDAAVKQIESLGGAVQLGTRVTALQSSSHGWAITTSHGHIEATGVIIATHPKQTLPLIAALPEAEATCNAIEQLEYEPIHSVYMQFDRAPALAAPMLGLADCTLQWVFDRAALASAPHQLAGVVSASSSLAGRSHDEIVADAVRDVQPLLQPGTRLLWSKLVQEKFATFRATPGLKRPTATTPWPRLFLAGDYIDGPYPATLESAVRSGAHAAKLMLGVA